MVAALRGRVWRGEAKVAALRGRVCRGVTGSCRGLFRCPGQGRRCIKSVSRYTDRGLFRSPGFAKTELAKCGKDQHRGGASQPIRSRDSCKSNHTSSDVGCSLLPSKQPVVSALGLSLASTAQRREGHWKGGRHYKSRCWPLVDLGSPGEIGGI
jgi:hypothetical protein